MKVYIAPEGCDLNNGNSEHPLRSFPCALELLRNSQDSEKIMSLDGGVYEDVSIELNHLDSGLEISASPGARPVLYGGKLCHDWKRDGIFITLDLATTELPEYGVRNLVVNGRMMPKARFPETGFLTHENQFDVRWMSSTAGGWERPPTIEELGTMKFHHGDLDGIGDTSNAEIRVYHHWDESLVGVKSVDFEKDIVHFTTPCGHPPGAFGDPQNVKTHWYVIFNIRKGMTRPGQWYFDRKSRKLYYYPLPEQVDLSTIHALIPTRESIISACSGPNPDHVVQDLKISGITLCGTNAPLGSMGFGAGKLHGAIQMSGNFKRINISNLDIFFTAGKGISIGGLRDSVVEEVTIKNCQIHDSGGGGIAIRGRRNRLEHNRIRNVGQHYPSSLAISFTGSDGVVSHNEIDGCPYTALQGGGDHIVAEFNRIRNFMQEMDDGAAIYFFAAKNCIYRYNLVEGHLEGRLAHGYYLDEQSEDSVVENNIAVNSGWPSHNHMAANCIVRNNCFIDKGNAVISIPNCSGFSFCENIVVADGHIHIKNVGPDGFAKFADNVFHSRNGGVFIHLSKKTEPYGINQIIGVKPTLEYLLC